MVTVEENIWIDMPDGCRLAARLWLPDNAATARVPAVFEYIPYRKRDGTRGRDEPMHRYFAENGYAALRVDMRGSGESDGLMRDEYVLQEQDDALAVIDWITAQPWCSGNVGMMGKSWGGFNCLQVAARRPKALKAIIPVCFTDNRFTDDIHYMGGCLLNDNLWWGTIMMAYQARPLDPEIVGDKWRADWLKRIEDMPFFPAIWLQHQRYGDYWKHGSICEDYDAIDAAVLAIGGWADAYSDALARLVENLSAPCKAIIGPWTHIYPHDGRPGPAIGFLQQCVQWWDRWLKGIGNGADNWPAMRIYRQDAQAPTGTWLQAPGLWLVEGNWPSPRIRPEAFHLNGDGGLSLSAGSQKVRRVKSPLSHGKAGGEFMGAGCDGEMATDQRLDDGGALVFETNILSDAVDVVGAPEMHLTLSADAPVAQVCVRLSDVSPTGEVLRVSFQARNLTHRDGHEQPEPLEPGKVYNVTFKLHDCAHRFAAGHRIRVSVATAYWPMVWPSPDHAEITLHCPQSQIVLPVHNGDVDVDEVVFDAPATAKGAPMTQLSKGTLVRTSTQDHVTGETTYITEGKGGLFGEGVLRFDDIGTDINHSLRRELTIKDDDPLSARARFIQTYDMGRDGWRTRSETVTEMTCDAEHFFLTGELRVFENGTEVTARHWRETIPRDLM